MKNGENEDLLSIMLPSAHSQILCVIDNLRNRLSYGHGLMREAGALLRIWKLQLRANSRDRARYADSFYYYNKCKIDELVVVVVHTWLR